MICVCKKCGTIFDGKFCPECGTEYGPVRVCEGCGTSFVGNYCPECGTKADAGDVTLSSAVVAGSEGLVYSQQGSGCAIMGTGNCKDADIVIPAEHGGKSVTQIWGNSFARRTGVMSVIIPDTVTDIQICAFADCTSLECVVFSKNVKSIGPDAFRNCTALGMVFFKGTVSEWNALSVHPSNACLGNARKFFYSEKKPVIPSYNMWHYDADGNIEIW
ncbi:MAG: leucine-rich repeat protein [Clostridia bacterium]|nr:leucine-rich repeat protein [Clostridia bacterium]